MAISSLVRKQQTSLKMLPTDLQFFDYEVQTGLYAIFFSGYTVLDNSLSTRGTIEKTKPKLNIHGC